MKKIECYDLPKNPDTNVVYTLLPKNPDDNYYHERTDRNIGWITRDEQDILRRSVVGVAGCGGMGGQVAQVFARLGVGEIRIADCEVFDVSNINRQFSARRNTVGKSKAFETAKSIRDITDDFKLVVYPQGICEETVDDFLSGCDVVCDEIELLALSVRILLHQRAREKNVSLFNCNTVGFSTNLFLYTPDSATIEEATGVSYNASKDLCYRAKNGDKNALSKIYMSIMRAVVPAIPNYLVDDSQTFNKRTLQELRVPIIATNPPMASGFLADRVLIYLLRNSSKCRDIIQTPSMPGYLYFDAAKMTIKIVRGNPWW